MPTIPHDLVFERTATMNARGGSTLVETMLACLILAIVALGGAEYLFRGRSALIIQKNRRLALEAANSRMEEWRATPYGDVTNLIPPASYGLTYACRSGATWVNGIDTANIAGVACPMTNALQYVDLDGGTVSYDAVRVTVSVAYSATIKDQVTVETLVAP